MNTPAAEVLYCCVGALADVDEDTIVLDICCGTGTIGLTLARVHLTAHYFSAIQMIQYT